MEGKERMADIPDKKRTNQLRPKLSCSSFEFGRSSPLNFLIIPSFSLSFFFPSVLEYQKFQRFFVRHAPFTSNPFWQRPRLICSI